MYIDTSLLVPYYCPEPLSALAERVLRDDLRPAVSDLVEVEFFSTLGRKVRERELSMTDATAAGAQFLGHLQGNLYDRIPLERRHYDIARGWLGRFTLPLRALDALHLAVAEFASLRLATCDEDLSRVARRVGVPVTLVR